MNRTEMTDSGAAPLEYWVDLARMGFEDDLHRLMNEQQMSRSSLAKATGTSPPYISKVLNGAGGNFTLETMVKMARALEALVEIRLALDGEEVVRVMSINEACEFDEKSETTESFSPPEEGGIPTINFGGGRLGRLAPETFEAEGGTTSG